LIREVFEPGASDFENRNAKRSLTYARTGSAKITPHMA